MTPRSDHLTLTRTQIQASAEKIFLWDTNNLLGYTGFFQELAHAPADSHRPRALFVIPRVVLREIDQQKKQPDSVGYRAREFSRQLEEFIQTQPRNALGSQSGNLTLLIDQETELSLGVDLRQLDPDEILLRVAHRYQERFGDLAEIYLCTADRNLRIQAALAEVAIHDFLEWDTTIPDQFYHPNLPEAMPFHSAQPTARKFQVPARLGGDEAGTLSIWPGYGYPSGEVMEYHLSYEEGEYRSPTLVLTAGEVSARPVRPGPYQVVRFDAATPDQPLFACLRLPNDQVLVAATHHARVQRVLLAESIRRANVNRLRNLHQAGNALGAPTGLIGMLDVMTRQSQIDKAWNATSDPIYAELSLRILLVPLTEEIRPVLEAQEAANPWLTATPVKRAGAQTVLLLVALVGLFWCGVVPGLFWWIFLR